MSFQEIIDVLEFSTPSLALAAALAFAAGILGVFVLLKRQSLAALALPQAVAVGVAVALRMGWPTLPPAIAATILCILLVTVTRSSTDSDALLAACYVGGLALTMLIVANAAQHLAEVQNRFVGIDVAVAERQAQTLAPALLAFGVITALLWRRWTLVTLAPAIAETARLHPVRWNALFFALLAAVVLLGTDALGSVMVLAFLFLPAASVLPWARRIPLALACSVLLGLTCLAAGFLLSVTQDWPLSQSVAGVGFVFFALSRLLRLSIKP